MELSCPRNSTILSRPFWKLSFSCEVRLSLESFARCSISFSVSILGNFLEDKFFIAVVLYVCKKSIPHIGYNFPYILIQRKVKQNTKKGVRFFRFCIFFEYI